MSVSEEKMLILKMLQEGKINSEEAARLLEALDGSTKQAGGDSSARQQRQSGFQDEINKTREKIDEMKNRINDWKNDFKKNNSQKDFDRMVEDFASKAEKLGKNVAATTFGVMDKVVDFVGSFVNTGAFNIFGSYNLVERQFEAPATDGMELYVEGVNAQVLVKKHLDSKIVIKSKVRSPINNADSILMFSDDGQKVSLALNKVGNISVSHEVFLPAVKFKDIRLETTNGKIYVEDSLSDTFEATTRNSHIDLMGVSADGITVNTKNAKIQMSYVIGKTIEINTNNSIIDIKNIKAENLKAVTMNGRIYVENAQNYENCKQLNMYLKTSNGGIKVNMNDMENRGYKIKAQTTNSGINVLIPEMTYHNINKQSVGKNFVEAESSNLGNYDSIVSIEAETMNGYIEVVK